MGVAPRSRLLAGDRPKPLFQEGAAGQPWKWRGGSPGTIRSVPRPFGSPGDGPPLSLVQTPRKEPQWLSKRRPNDRRQARRRQRRASVPPRSAASHSSKAQLATQQSKWSGPPRRWPGPRRRRLRQLASVPMPRCAESERLGRELKPLLPPRSGRRRADPRPGEAARHAPAPRRSAPPEPLIPSLLPFLSKQRERGGDARRAGSRPRRSR
jgi:hypothetical protein